MTHVLERGLWVAQADETKPVQSYPQTRPGYFVHPRRMRPAYAALR